MNCVYVYCISFFHRSNHCESLLIQPDHIVECISYNLLQKSQRRVVILIVETKANACGYALKQKKTGPCSYLLLICSCDTALNMRLLYGPIYLQTVASVDSE